MKKSLSFLTLIIGLFAMSELAYAVADCNLTLEVQKEGRREAFFKAGETANIVFASNCPGFLIGLKPDEMMDYYDGNQTLQYKVVTGEYYFFAVTAPDKSTLKDILEQFKKDKANTQKKGFDFIYDFLRRLRNASHLKAEAKIYGVKVY